MKNLLNPRFEVIANYPKSIYKIGEIIDNGYEFIYCDTDGLKYTDFPHLFKKLNWWENREEKEMPKYLKCDQFKEVYEIEYWDMKYLTGKIKGENAGCNLLQNVSGYLLATKKEYENYVANL